MRVVSKKEAMAALGISKRTLERRLADGTLASHVAHGPHGPERRVHLPDPPAPPSPGADDPGTGVMPAPPPAPDALLLPESEALALLLGVLDERQRKIEEWAVRYGRLEAEVESLRRAQTDAHGPLRRLWARLRGRRGRP
jgi:hypothetical protein